MSIRLRSKVAGLLCAVVGMGALVVPAAQATTITYDFTVHATSGPLAGTDSSGSFSYDSSVVVPGTLVPKMGLLTSLVFTFNGTAYDATTANTGWLGFDAAGNLNSFTFGNACSAGSCGVQTKTNQWYAVKSFFQYATTSVSGGFQGTVTWSRAGASVPEPGALGLFGFGLLLLAGAGLRRRLVAGPSQR